MSKHNMSSTCLYCLLPLIYFGSNIIFSSTQTDQMFFIWSLGGLKLWEGSLDLIKALNSDIRSGHISFSKKRVLEVSS